MSAQNPVEYAAALKQSGASDQIIVAILRNAGWPEKEAVAALAEHYATTAGMAPPARAKSLGDAREAFLHLLAFATLATWTIAAGSLWFTLIDLWLPDVLDIAVRDVRLMMARDLACVLVAFPVYMMVMRFLWREMLDQPVQASSALRRWLTYMAMLIAAGTLVGDLVAFVEHLLRGEITARFASKVVTVLVIAGGVFWFYLGSVRLGGDATARLKRYRRHGMMVAAALVALTLVFSFAKFGSHAYQRSITADLRRSEDLAAIGRAVRLAWEKSGEGDARKLPAKLEGDPSMTGLRLSDPVTYEPYSYSVLGGSRYQLCAHFETDTTRDRRRGFDEFRVHPAGVSCFTQVAGAPLR